ncbi:MAG TPA: tetratricopeptide repeat protein, partial [Candidatus Hodarchaeales archaeon]|nr:tetratricopeptide repeat protein [Candidatus Hodarchaeales archaeon]
MSYLNKGDHIQAIKHLSKAVTLKQRLFGDDHISIASSCVMLGEVYDSQGDYERALDFYHKALVLYKKHLNRRSSDIAVVKGQLGASYANRDDLDVALQFAQQALSLHRESLGESHPALGRTHETLGNIYRKRGDYVLALSHYQSALMVRSHITDSNDRNDIANLYSEIGAVYAATREYHRALEYYNNALKLHRNLPEQNRPQLATTLKGLGDIYAQQNEFTLALAYYQQSMIVLVPEFSDSSIQSNPTPRNVTYGKALLSVFAAKASTLEKYYSESHIMSYLQAALATYECAANVSGLLRKKLTAEGSKLFLDEESHSLHQNAIRISMMLFDATQEKRYKEAAFYFAENSRANVLLDGLVDSEAKQFTDIPDSIIEREKSLRTDLAYYSTKLQKEIDKKEYKDTVKIVQLRNKCFALNYEMQELLTLLENTYTQYYDLKYRNNSPTVTEIQQALDHKTCVVEYSVGEHSINVFTITKNSYNITVTSKPLDFEHTAWTFYRSIKTVERDEYVRTGAELYNVLLRPLGKLLSRKSRLIIIPDGILHYVPFEALIDRGPKQNSATIDFP